MATRTFNKHRELFAQVGVHIYLIRYLPGREEEAAEQMYQWVRSKEFNFDWEDSDKMGADLDAYLRDDALLDGVLPNYERRPENAPYERASAEPLPAADDVSWWEWCKVVGVWLAFFMAAMWVRDRWL